MPKFSVKKPFTVLVAVILVVVLGFVSLAGMQTDLLPNMNLPYLLVVTTYPGASPEQVESDVTQPLENSLSTLNGVKNVTSQSNENYSLVILEYQDDTDMDSAMVKASTAVNQLSDSLPDMASTPMLMEMSPDMMATQYIAVDYDGMDIYELSDYVEDSVIPQLERVDGVASVSTTGLVKKSVEITLDQDKIDEVNDKLLVKVSDRLAEAKKQLDENDAKIKNGLAELDTAQSQLDSGKAELDTQKQSLTEQLRDAINQLNAEIPKLEAQIAGLKGELETAQSKLGQLKADPGSLPEVTLPIDDALFASCKEILAKYDPHYDSGTLPANLEEAKSDLTKMTAMQASIERAQQALEAEASAMTGGLSIREACAALDAQIMALTAQVQQKDNEILQLQQKLETAAPEEQDAIRAEIESKKAEQAALQAQLDAATSQRAALDDYRSAESTLSTTRTALQNATVLLKARQEAEASLNESTEELRKTLQQTISTLNTQIDKGEAMLADLNEQRGKLQSMLKGLAANPTDPKLADMAVQLLFSGTEAQLGLGEFQISSGRTQLDAGKTQLDAARKEYESAREEALKSANLDQLLNMNTLKQLIAAQNFSMPAGYIDGGEGDSDQYILKVGDAFDNVDELKSMVLCTIDGIGDVRLSDVADIELTDNADDSYAKVGKNRAVLLSIYKSSTASTSSVSNASTAAMKDLMAENDGLHLTTIMDQGDYIKLIVNSVLSNLIEGAVLAIIVLALFLKDIRPTLVVAISMPLSVLFAIVLMYFTGITLN
ncbi:efflux RND transporter permease subunit, partial [Gemmiger sp.]|uniref:efflux RND transporter permease subunit n=1 Tax=Gemmiger sp. TaxID=2049027 RepID=UPI002F91E4C2